MLVSGSSLGRNAVKSRRKRSLRNGIRALALALTPQPIRCYFFTDAEWHPPKLRSSSYLDGIRAFAALFVVNYHFLNALAKGQYAKRGIFRGFFESVPTRVAFGGHQMVETFFILGGLAISIRPLQLKRQHSQSDLLRSLSSSAFRRAFRLYLPLIAISLIDVLLIYAGAYEAVRWQVDNNMLTERHPSRKATLWMQMVDWVYELSKLTDVFSWKVRLAHIDLHLWTMGNEFRSSLILYTILLVTANLKASATLVITFCFSIYAFSHERWEVTCYLWGSCLAQVEMLYGHGFVRQDADPVDVLVEKQSATVNGPQHRSRSTPFEQPWQRPKPIRRRLWKPLFLCGICLAFYLISCPKNPDRGLGFRTLFRFTPKWLVPTHAAIAMPGVCLLIFLLGRQGPAASFRRFLEHRYLQYIASISFGMYLVHGPIQHIIGFRIPLFIWNLMGVPWNESFTLGWVFGMSVGLLITHGMVILFADLFTREIGQRCINVTLWLENALLVDEKPVDQSAHAHSKLNGHATPGVPLAEPDFKDGSFVL